MEMKDIFSRKNAKKFVYILTHYISILASFWFRFTAPEKPSQDAPLAQKEAARRGKLTSMVLCIILSVATSYVPFIFSMGNVVLTTVYVCIILFISLAAPLNQRGRTTLAGLIVITNIEVTLITILLIYPGGLNIVALPMLSFLVIPTLLAVSMLPAWSVFPVALCNLGIIYISILFLPKAPALQALLSSSPPAIFGIPTVLQCIVSAISFLWVRGASQGIKEADRADELDRLYQELARVAEVDAMTDLPNHRMIMKHIMEEIKQCEQVQRTCAIMFVDLDHFKQINDTWGHLVGDAVLHEVGQRLQRAVSPAGIVGRYGGEEFAVVLKGSDLSHAYQVAEQARIAITATPCFWHAEDREVSLTVTASIGIAIYGLHGKISATLLEQADHAMYRAKQQGRNRVCISDVFTVDEQESVAPVVIQQESPAETAAVQSLMAVAQAHDVATEAHASRLVFLAGATASRLGCSKDEQHLIRLAAVLHDIGKVGIPENILRKPGALTVEEWQIMRMHPTIGSNILTQVESLSDQIANIVQAHHERWDGQGYPLGLVLEAIPLGARIISVVDSYDAMTSLRPYRRTLLHAHARAELLRCAGTQYDPQVVTAFLEVLELQEPSLSQPLTADSRLPHMLSL